MARVSFHLFRRQFAEAAQAAEKISDNVVSNFPGALCDKYVLIGTSRHLINDPKAAREAFAKAKTLAEERIRQSPNEAAGHVQLATALAWLGEKDAAIAEAKKAVEILPESKDAFEGPDIAATAAEVYAIVGESDRAIDLLEGLLQRPSLVTVPMLKLNPAWDPLRSNPRFQVLLDKYAAQYAVKT